MILSKKGVDKTLLDRLRKEKISSDIIRGIEAFREKYPAPPSLTSRIPAPTCFYYGKEIWEQAAAALLCGKNLLLAGPKATGKNIFAENLAAAFGRPRWDISFHVNMDASTLIGCDTFENGSVCFRPGPIYQCARYGGFGILDEINMAKSEAMAVLHAALDFRRVLDVPGYDRIELAKPARFVATMNYGYAGTKELNEALVSRFVVIQMPMISGDSLQKLLLDEFPSLQKKYAEQFSSLFLELWKKCENGEISSRALDLRGLLDAVELIRWGLNAQTALEMGIVNKSFDDYERTLIQDVIRGRIWGKADKNTIFK